MPWVVVLALVFLLADVAQAASPVTLTVEGMT
jgi:hypothetical protein